MPTNRQTATAAIEQAGIVAVIRIKDPAKLQGVVDAISAGGIRALEVTMTVPGAIELIAALAPKMPAGFLLGAGTVVETATVGLPVVFVPLPHGNGEQARNADFLIEAGAGVLVPNAELDGPRLLAETLPLLIEPARLEDAFLELYAGDAAAS